MDFFSGAIQLEVWKWKCESLNRVQLFVTHGL